jgi:Immunoglobulin domain
MEILQFVFLTKIFCSKVLPTIIAFNFGEEELNLDESVSITCSITKGDSPLHIWWTFESDTNNLTHNLTSNDGIILSRNTQKISVLAIEAVKARHRGNYTCFAQNRAGLAQYSSFLLVNGK